MRRLKLQVQATLDGYMGGANGEMDWMLPAFTPDLGAHITGIMTGVDTIVLGRRLAEGFIPHWAARPEHEPDEAIDFMNVSHRVVVSRTLASSPWDNATIAPSLDAVATLKDTPGGDLIAYGGATLVAGLIEAGLVDELHLFVHPVSIGAGLPVFGHGRHDFSVIATTRFDGGILGTTLAPAKP